MNDRQIDDILNRSPALPEAVAEKIRARIQADTQPVKVLTNGYVYALLFLLVALLISLAYASLVHYSALSILSTSALQQLFLCFAAAAFLGSAVVARSMRPASGRLPIWLLAGLASAAYEFLILRLFHDFSTNQFVENGIKCLALGVLGGVLVGAPLWFLVRRGLVVQPIRAGAAIGFLGGMSGLAVLTAHCRLLSVPHAGVWHAGIIVVCVAMGALIGRAK